MKRSLIFLGLILSLSSCNSGEPQSNIRAVHALSGGSFADISLNDAVQVQNLPYGEVSNTFSVADGGGEITFTVAESAIPAVQDVITFTPGFDYLLFFAGELDSGSVVKKLVDPASPAVGNFKMRFSNLAKDGKSLDFYFLFPGQSPEEATPLEDRLGFLSFTDYVEVEQGAFSVVATDRRSKQIVFSTGLLAFEAGQSYTFCLLSTGSDGQQFDYILVTER